MLSDYEDFTDFGCDQSYCIDGANGRCGDPPCCFCICNSEFYPYADRENKKCLANPVTNKPTTTASTTDFGCDQIYCIDRANGGCVDGRNCCNCICSRIGYPYADKVNKKCLANPITNKPTTAASTTAIPRTSTLQVTTFAPTKETTETRAINVTTAFQNGSTSGRVVVDATTAPIVTNKGSVPIGAIVGSVLGVIVVIALVLLVWLLLRRYKTKSAEREKEKMKSVENGNNISLLPPEDLHQQAAEKETDNPYYKSVDEDNTYSSYQDPQVVIKGRKGNEYEGVYYSSADFVSSKDEPKKEFEYSYARGEERDTKKPNDNPGGHYQALAQPSVQQEVYQSLQTDGKPDTEQRATLQQENPYYDSGAREDIKRNNLKPGMNMSLKNNAGSRENVSVIYDAVDPYHKHGLPIPSKPNVHKSEEYLDMSCGSKSDGEYMYAAP